MVGAIHTVQSMLKLEEKRKKEQKAQELKLAAEKEAELAKPGK